ncbi:MAG TPA: dephospho-CoA kinase [Gammaproteobacteria bacterium]|nr:dephospho-CoA kinase [Gammaproteobacteria bacterium]
MLHVGLTGGIGAGKSAVSRCFREHGAHIIDADRLARELLAPGSDLLEEVAAAFGGDLLDEDGRLRRGLLAERVFADPDARRRLDALLHPRINALERERAAAIGARLPAAVVIYAAPLLLESGAADGVDRVLVVDLPETLQRQRAIARGDRGPEQVRAIMEAQWPREERLAHADDVIDNSGPWPATAEQIEALMERYRALAGEGAVP